MLICEIEGSKFWINCIKVLLNIGYSSIYRGEKTTVAHLKAVYRGFDSIYSRGCIAQGFLLLDTTEKLVEMQRLASAPWKNGGVVLCP